MGLFLGCQRRSVRSVTTGESGRAVTSCLPLLEVWCAPPSTAPNFTPDQFSPISPPKPTLAIAPKNSNPR